jgi:S1-C subfamily serine protease
MHRFPHLLLTFLTPALCLAQDTPQLAKPPAKAGQQVQPRRRIVAKPIVAAPEAAQTRSLLKVNVTAQPYDLHLPWQKQSPINSRGLGVVLEGNRVLVTAQLVADANYIEIEQPDGGQKLAAKVIAVDYEANLALLESAINAEKEKAFFAGLEPMKVDTSARIGDAVAVWQTGRVGELIQTPLIISKILTRRYVVEGSGFLVYETTGIIRSEANSFTLPVIKGGKLAGLLLSYDSKNQVTTILPAPIIEHFLNDFADGAYEGFPGLGMEFQVTLDEQLREYLGMKPDAPGVLVSAVVKGASAEKAGLKKGDILLAINGHSIDARGDYQDPQYGPLSTSHIVRGKAYVGDDFELKIIRDGAEQVLKGKLTRKNPDDYLVTPYRFDKGPPYILMGGLIFQELSRPYLDSFGEQQTENSALLRLSHIARDPDELEEAGRKKLVFLANVLPTPSAQGYDQLGGIVVNKVNGRTIAQLRDLDAAFKDLKGTTHVIELDDFPHVLYLDAAAVDQDNQRLQSGAYRISGLKRLE